MSKITESGSDRWKGVVITHKKKSANDRKKTPTSSSSSQENKKLYAKKSGTVSNKQAIKTYCWQLQKGRSTEERDLVIGFDLGTAFTKVVIQDRQLRKTYAVPFNGVGLEESIYLLPTILYSMKDGRLSLNPKGTKHTNIKMNLIKEKRDSSEKEIDIIPGRRAIDYVAAFIGLVLIQTRLWLFTNKRNEYKHLNIEWILNLGLPSSTFDNETLIEKFKLAALAGWNCTLTKKNHIKWGMVKQAVDVAALQLKNNDVDKTKEQLHPDNVELIPEIIAEIIGYMKSPFRQDGLYLLIDIGAGTLDAATFIINDKEGDDLYVMVYSEVIPMGVNALHDTRIAKCKQILNNRLVTLNNIYDGLAPIPEIEEYSISFKKEECESLNCEEINFISECSNPIKKILRNTMSRKNPLDTDWKEGCPVFLCGGGSNVEQYNTIFKQICSDWYGWFPGFQKKEMPRPANLENKDIPPNNFHRMSVSYGLSFSKLDIGIIIPPKDRKEYLIYIDSGKISTRKKKAKPFLEEYERKGLYYYPPTQESYRKPEYIDRFYNQYKPDFSYFNDYSAVKD